MIISASRRTDIPAFYGEWLMQRLHAGFCQVRNPYNPRQITRVSLRPDEVEALVMWTKNPAPMLPQLDLLEGRGFRTFFQFTLNDYPTPLEPGVQGVSKRIEIFQELSKRVGPDRVIWRYDPIMLSNVTDAAFHRLAFSRLCEQLAPSTRRVVVSVLDRYKKNERRLWELSSQGFSFVADPLTHEETKPLLASLAKTAKQHDLEIVSCAEPMMLADVGIAPGACIDGLLLQRVFSLPVPQTKDPHQRPQCRCVASKDIGAFDTCLHGCPYCYATKDQALAQTRNTTHDPSADVLVPSG